jgi:beta-phosphoglucomutase-like phosphatase (HAD superfamily)
MLRALIFDIDGVLLDSYDANHDFINRLLQTAGYHELTREAYQRMAHLSLRALAQVHTQAEPPELDRISTLALTVPRSPHLIRIPTGVKPVLEQFSKTFLLGIVTSRMQRGVDECFQLTGTEELFNTVVRFGDYTHAKPHPEPLLLAAKRLGIAPGEAVYIGDTESDAQAAVAAGMMFIAYTEFSRLQLDADASAAAFVQLPAAVAAVSAKMRKDG